MTKEVENVDVQDFIIPEALQFLIDGYSDYSSEVVTDRAIDGIDGLKPSQRRILYLMYKSRVKELTKSQTIAGQVLKYHPHGDASVYDTMVRMVDSSENMSVPYLEGKGNFGKVYSTNPAAAPRYTNVKLAPISDEVFKNMDGIKMIPTYDSEDFEPELLPVSFPSLLVNAVSGIAVGLSTDRPSFNFHDVIKATIEYIETGSIKGVLYPDFTTGGVIVKDEAEMEKIMVTGHGRMKLRGEWFIDNKTIVITKVPYYTTGKAIKTKAEEIEGVVRVIDESDRKNGFRLTIECNNKKNVEYVLNQVLRVSDLQMTRVSNMVVVVDKRPLIIGVRDIIAEWVKFRRGIVLKSLNRKREGLLISIARYEAMVTLLGDEAKRIEFVETLAKKGEGAGRQLLYNWYPNVDSDVIEWILDMKVRQFANRNSYVDKLEGYKANLKETEGYIANVDGYIVRELKEINAKYSFPRRTQITEEDYEFEAEEEVVVKAEAIPVIVQINGKFINKVRSTRLNDNEEGIRCMSDDVISFIDTQGRLLRVYLEHLEFKSIGDRGVYLPLYLEVEDDFDIVAYEVIQDKKVGYVYSDGFVSVVDYSEWVDAKRATRITQNGVSTLAGSIIQDFELTNNYLMLVTDKGKFGFARTDFKEKHRTARTKLIPLKKGEVVTTVIPLSYVDIMNLVSSPERYMDKVSSLHADDTFNNELYNDLISQ